MLAFLEYDIQNAGIGWRHRASEIGVFQMSSTLWMVIVLTVHLYCLIVHFELVSFSYRNYFPFFPVVLFSWEDYEKKFKDTTCVLRSHKSKDSQCTGQKNMTNNNLQNTTQKTKDPATQTPLNKRKRIPKGYSNPCASEG